MAACGKQYKDEVKVDEMDEEAIVEYFNKLSDKAKADGKMTYDLKTNQWNVDDDWMESMWRKSSKTICQYAVSHCVKKEIKGVVMGKGMNKVSDAVGRRWGQNMVTLAGGRRAATALTSRSGQAMFNVGMATKFAAKGSARVGIGGMVGGLVGGKVAKEAAKAAGADEQHAAEAEEVGDFTGTVAASAAVGASVGAVLGPAGAMGGALMGVGGYYIGNVAAYIIDTIREGETIVFPLSTPIRVSDKRHKLGGELKALGISWIKVTESKMSTVFKTFYKVEVETHKNIDLQFTDCTNDTYSLRCTSALINHNVRYTSDKPAIRTIIVKKLS